MTFSEQKNITVSTYIHVVKLLNKARYSCTELHGYQTHAQGDHLSGKPRNVREFETCQGNVKDVVNSQGIVREMSGIKSCHGKVKCPTTVHY